MMQERRTQENSGLRSRFDEMFAVYLAQVKTLNPERSEEECAAMAREMVLAKLAKEM
jgi:hypothetical protein